MKRNRRTSFVVIAIATALTVAACGSSVQDGNAPSATDDDLSPQLEQGSLSDFIRADMLLRVRSAELVSSPGQKDPETGVRYQDLNLDSPEILFSDQQDALAPDTVSVPLVDSKNTIFSSSKDLTNGLLLLNRDSSGSTGWYVGLVLQESGDGLEIVGNPDESGELNRFLEYVNKSGAASTTPTDFVTSWLAQKARIESKSEDLGSVAADSPVGLYQSYATPPPIPDEDALAQLQEGQVEQRLILDLREINGDASIAIKQGERSLLEIASSLGVGQTRAALNQKSVLEVWSRKENSAAWSRVLVVPPEDWSLQPATLIRLSGDPSSPEASVGVASAEDLDTLNGAGSISRTPG